MTVGPIPPGQAIGSNYAKYPTAEMCTESAALAKYNKEEAGATYVGGKNPSSSWESAYIIHALQVKDAAAMRALATKIGPDFPKVFSKNFISEVGKGQIIDILG